MLVSFNIRETVKHTCYMRGSRGGDRGSGPPPPPGKLQKYRVPLQYWSGSFEKSQSYQASIPCWAIIGPPAKRHLNGVSLAGRVDGPLGGILILPPLINLKKTKKKRQSWRTSSDKTFWIRACVRMHNVKMHAGAISKLLYA